MLYNFAIWLPWFQYLFVELLKNVLNSFFDSEIRNYFDLRIRRFMKNKISITFCPMKIIFDWSMPWKSSNLSYLMGWPIILITLGMISRAENSSVDFLGSMTPCQWIKAGTRIPPSQVVAFPHLDEGIGNSRWR